MLVYLILLFTVGTALANNDCSVCADAKPIENIDWKTFLSGEWYEYYRFAGTWQDGMKCITFAFNRDTGELKVTAVKDNKAISFKGYFAHHNDKGIIIICSDALFEYTGAACMKLYIVNLRFLESVLFYSCRQDEKTGDIQEYAWGFTRNTTLEGDLKYRVEKSFNSTNYIDPSRFEYSGRTRESPCIK